jgi:hypothetical protein
MGDELPDYYLEFIDRTLGTELVSSGRVEKLEQHLFTDNGTSFRPFVARVMMTANQQLSSDGAQKLLR